MKSKEEIQQLIYGCFGEKEWDNISANAKLSLIQTYTQCKEDIFDKKYTEEDMLKAFEYGKTIEPFDCFEDFINSLNKQSQAYKTP